MANCCERTNRLPGTVQAVISGVIDAGAGNYSIRVLGMTLLAKANLPGQLTYSAGEQVVVTRLGVSTEYLILGGLSS